MSGDGAAGGAAGASRTSSLQLVGEGSAKLAWAESSSAGPGELGPEGFSWGPPVPGASQLGFLPRGGPALPHVPGPVWAVPSQIP